MPHWQSVAFLATRQLRGPEHTETTDECVLLESLQVCVQAANNITDSGRDPSCAATMMAKRNTMASGAALLLLGLASMAPMAQACSSVLLWDEIAKGNIVSARTMDYSSDLAFSLWKVSVRWVCVCV